MNFSAIGIPVGCAMLLADATNMLPISSDVMQGGAIITLSWCVCWMLAKTIPAYLKAMKDQSAAHMLAIKEQRDAFLDVLKSIDDSE